MAYLPTFGLNVGKYTIHGFFGFGHQNPRGLKTVVLVKIYFINNSRGQFF